MSKFYGVSGQLIKDLRFLLAQLYFDSLKDRFTPKKIKSTLETLSESSEGLKGAYAAAINRISTQSDEACGLAKKAISWIALAKRQLTTTELQTALAVEPGDKALDDDNIAELEDIVEVCAGLVTIDKVSDIIRLVHYTTLEYFVRNLEDWVPTASTDITRTCLTYLCFDVPPTSSWVVEQDFFFNYAAHFWVYHNIRGVEALALQLFTSKLNFRRAVLRYAPQKGRYSRTRSWEYFNPADLESITALHVMAFFGLADLLAYFLQDDHCEEFDFNSRVSYGQTPLSLACKSASLPPAEPITASQDSAEHSGRRNPSSALPNQQEAVVRLLIGVACVDVNLKDLYGKPPLAHATEGGQTEIVRLLLSRSDIRADTKDAWGGTPLISAAAGGHIEIVELLLDREGVDCSAYDSIGRTPISCAVEGGSLAVFRLLLKRLDSGGFEKNSFGPNRRLFYCGVAECRIRSGTVSPPRHGRQLQGCLRSDASRMGSLFTSLGGGNIRPTHRPRRCRRFKG